MNLEQDIIAAFPTVKEAPLIKDDFIKNNQNIMEISGDVQYFKVVPAYMLWSIKNKDSELVDMYTVNALAEYGRTKIKDNDYFNFKWRCNEEQRNVVISFLEWCMNEILTAEVEQIERALKHWSK